MTSILIVEDREMISSAIKDLLLVNGYEVSAIASDGKEAIALYESTKPDLVLMDLLLPDMNGLEAAKKILQDHPDARFLAITAVTNESMFEECIRAGFKGLIKKPFRMKELLEVIGSAL